VALSRHLTTVHGTEINQTPLKRLAIRTVGVFGSRTEIAANSRYTREYSASGLPSTRDVSMRYGLACRISGSVNGTDARNAGGIWNRAGSNRHGDNRADHTPQRTFGDACGSTIPKALRQQITWLVIGADGEDDFVQQLKRLVATVECDVRFLGSMPDEAIRDIYGAADFFCLTGVPDCSGRVDGFGLVYLEAAAGGLPSVATAIGGVPDAVLADETGLLVPPSIEDIARAITKLAEDTDTRSVLAAGASAHARALSWERCAAETYRLSRSVKRTVDNISDGLLTETQPSQAKSAQQVSPA
jgi:hypothetical protein